jgi:Mg2+ and Co2+ transporter CorA
VASGQQRAKIEEYRDHLYLVAYAVTVRPETRALHTVEVDIFIGRNYVVTVHRGPVPAVEEALVRWTGGREKLRESFNTLLRREQPLFSSDTLAYFRDVHESILRILDVVEIEREMVTGALEAHMTVVSNRLNVTMRALTVVTIAVALASSIFGAWGMNFTRIPLAETPWGFWGVCGGVVAMIVALLGISRARGWL